MNNHKRGTDMSALGQRIVEDTDKIAEKREAANFYEGKAAQLRREADEMERLLELARRS